MRWLDGIIDPMDMSKLCEIVKGREAWHDTVHGTQRVETTEQLNNNNYNDNNYEYFSNNHHGLSLHLHNFLI